MVTFKITHARRSGFCVEGIRQFCDQHDLSYRELVRHGITDDKLRELGEDALVDMMLEVKKEEDT